ncbi:MAG: hypothetical protein JJ896_11505 [Rhodothermales bacterium]|nr:hypothetical protein [Rhodothermales bacterium]MBO6780269.1 hypothetical protein [Rhodothermales bacterium]
MNARRILPLTLFLIALFVAVWHWSVENDRARVATARAHVEQPVLEKAPPLDPDEAVEREAELAAAAGLPLEPAAVGDPHVPAVSEPVETGPRASFAVQVKDLVVPYSVMGLFVLPGEEVEFETVFERPEAEYSLLTESGTLLEASDGQWIWKAPEQPGYYPLFVEGPVDRIQFNVLVQEPFRNGPALFNGYRIGAYQSKPLRGDVRFNPPEGLIPVTEETAAVRVSPSFTLASFASHQPGNPRYMILDERLLIKLEMLLDELQSDGFDVTTFTVMSAFRTPWYNASIGNTTRYSLHLYGRAADIFIDEDGDGRMDDLNGNGREDIGDARVLYDFIDRMKEQAWYQPFLGGMGLYGPKPHRGPFVHVDVRGYVARW